MRRVLAAIILFCAAGASPALAETITVSPDAGGTIDPLQRAVDRAKAGDTIIVNDGEYRGNLSLSDKYGTPNAPITIQSRNPQGAKIIGPSNGSTISAWGVGHVTIQGFHVEGRYQGQADNNVFHIGGPFTNPATGVAIVGNRVTGVANDGIKFMEGAAGNLILGNLIDGAWKEEAMDNVSVQDMVIANNTIRGSAGNSGLTYKAGAHNFQITENVFDIDADVQISNGGYGDSRDTRWDRMTPQFKFGDEARNSTVTNNVINGSVRLVSAHDITIENNDLNGTVSNGRNVFWSGAITSHSNTVRNNNVANADAGAGDLQTAIPDVPTGPGPTTPGIGEVPPGQPPIPAVPTQPGTPVAGDPILPTNPGTVAPVDPGTVQVPPGQPPIPAAPTTPGQVPPQVVYQPPVGYVPPTPPAPASPGSVLGNLSANPIFAQTPAMDIGVLNGIVDTFKNQASLWESTLSAIATSLFVKLAIIELIWVFGWATAKRVPFDDMLGIMAEQIVIIGFFYWLLINTADFILAIIDSFGMAANQASIAGGGMANLGPSDIFAAGLNMTKTIWDGMTVMNIPFSILLGLAGLINVVVFAKIIAKLIEVLIESAICAYGGIILMGFGGTKFTRDYAVAVFRYGISVGVKRLFLQLIIGLGQGIVVGWATTLGSSGALSWTTIGIMIGAPLIMLGLADTLPQRAQDIIMGAYTGGSGAAVGKAAGIAAATAVAAAAGATGGVVAANQAYQLAKVQLEQRQQQAGNAGQTSGARARAGRAAQLAGMATRNMTRAAAADVGRRMNGTGGRFGHRTWRMAHDMQQQRRA